MGKDELLCGNVGPSPRKESHFQVKAGGGGLCNIWPAGCCNYYEPVSAVCLPFFLLSGSVYCFILSLLHFVCWMCEEVGAEITCDDDDDDGLGS